MIYSPEEDSYLLESQVRKYAKNKSFIDIGSGSGIQAISAIKGKAKSVTVSEVDEESLKYLREQFKGENIKIIKSNLFSKIKGKFDLIAFNPPYLPEDKLEDKESRRATTGGKKGDEIIVRFLNQAVKHLNKEGIILLVVSSLTPKERISKTLKNLKLKKKVLSKEKLFFEYLEVWKIIVK